MTRSYLFIIVLSLVCFFSAAPAISAVEIDRDLIPTKSKKSRVYVVGVYEPNGASRGFRQSCQEKDFLPVTVKIRKKARVTLVLSAYECIQWIIKKPKRTKIKRVIVNGYHEARVSGVSAKRVNFHVYEVNGEYLSNFPYGTNNEQFESGYGPGGAACDGSFTNLPDSSQRKCELKIFEEFLYLLREQFNVRSYKKFKGKYTGEEFSFGSLSK